MKLYALIPFLLAPLAASVAVPEVNNGVVNANTDATPATGAVENLATDTAVTTLEVNADDVATMLATRDEEINGDPEREPNRDRERGPNWDRERGPNWDRERGPNRDHERGPDRGREREPHRDYKREEQRHCNNINLWCPPNQICYRSICVTPGGLTARADEPIHEEQRCRMNMDCPPSQSCVRGECRGRIPPEPRCRMDRDFGPNQSCDRGECRGRIHPVA